MSFVKNNVLYCYWVCLCFCLGNRATIVHGPSGSSPNLTPGGTGGRYKWQHSLAHRPTNIRVILSSKYLIPFWVEAVPILNDFANTWCIKKKHWCQINHFKDNSDKMARIIIAFHNYCCPSIHIVILERVMMWQNYSTFTTCRSFKVRGFKSLFAWSPCNVAKRHYLCLHYHRLCVTWTIPGKLAFKCQTEKEYFESAYIRELKCDMIQMKYSKRTVRERQVVKASFLMWCRFVEITRHSPTLLKA